MTALCKNHGCGFGNLSPVTSYKAMAHMYIADTLCVDNIHDFTESSRYDKVLYCLIEGCISENVTYKHTDTLFSCSFRDFKAFLGCRRNRLFKKNVIALFDSHHGRIVMHLILSTNHYNIRKLILGKKLFIAFKTVFIGNTVFISEIFSL